MPQTETGDTDETLPDRLSKKERHRAHLSAGTHPEMDFDSEYHEIISSRYTNVPVYDGDGLIRLMNGGRCPVCGDVGGFRIDNSFAFVRGVEHRRFGDGDVVQNPVTERVLEAGFRPVVHAAHNHYFIGLATPAARSELDGWRQGENERKEFHSGVNNLRGIDYIDGYFGHGYSHGQYLAAIMMELGAEGVDYREYADRSNITKAQLAAILARLQVVNVTDKRGTHWDDYYAVNELGNAEGIHWPVPEWARRRAEEYDETHLLSTPFYVD